MSTEKMREEFEGACYREGYNPQRDLDGLYHFPLTRSLWWAWQASRAGIEVELPEIKAFEGAYDSYKQNEFVPFMTDVDDADEIFGLMRGIEVREAIESLGLKVKP